MTWFSNLNPTVKAALVAALVTLTGILIKDVIVAFLLERKKTEKELRAVFQKYADPLSSAATSLLWRLHEVFSKEGRGAYLRADASPNPYNSYKKLSTLYRVACLMAWIRAFRRELSYLRVREKEHFESLQAALNEFESALADGPQMEVERLERLIRLWDFPKVSKSDEPALAVEIDQTMHRQFHLEGLHSSDDVPGEVQTRVCEVIAATLAKGLKVTPLSNDVLRETKSRAFDILTIKETWFYRDWQAALGDQMIESVKGSARQFDVIGFGVFESIWLSDDSDRKRLLLRLNEILEKLDISLTYDCRVRQLRKVFQATARLVKALGSMPNRDTISGATLQTAIRVAAETTEDCKLD
jgi:hypothetical protein